ncbi:MAG: M48 family metalloprotease [Chitinophagaceae bacterium]|nr:M48 family metalloprotease [Chitinophagaceae bacterium]
MIQAVCWTLVHSLWEGLVFAMAAGGVLLLTRRARSTVRYNILCGLFFLFLAVCVGTLVYEWRASGEAVNEGGISSGVVTGGWVAEWIGALGRYCSDHALLIVWVWLFFFSVRSLRMLGSLLYIQRLRHYGISAVSAEWQKKVDELSRQLGIRRTVKLMESRIVKMPLVTGHWRPMIFIPLGLLTGLPAGEIEAVLLHELAHIRRNDWLINFLQHIAGNLLFFNPGFLWISALLREERENCCDDVAIDGTRDRIQFIRALINFKEHDLRMTRMANAFPAGKNQLLKRVTRIANNTNKSLDPAEKIFLAMSCVLISLLMIATGASSKRGKVQMGQLPKGQYNVVIDTPVVVDERKLVVKEEPAPVVVNKRKLDDLRKKFALDRKKSEADRLISLISDKERAEKDAKQAAFDLDQAERDKVQAERDVKQAARDKKQAILDKIQAESDKLQAARDAVRASPPIVNLKK